MKKGISLITLVVTIIVILILSAAVIITLAGDNNIISEAKDAVALSNEAVIKEQLSLALSKAEAQYWSEFARGEGTSKSDYISEEKLNEILNGTAVISDLNTNANGVMTLSYLDVKSQQTYRFQIDSSGDIILDVLSNKITSANYGDLVEYSANGIDDWRLFYNDGKNVFIIASDNIPNTKNDASKTNMTFTGTHRAYWNGSSAVPNLQPTNKLSLFKLTGYVLKKYSNSRFTSTLLNTNNWTSFVDTSKATYAIGSPTLEMWLASWNEKYNDSLVFSTVDDGYVIGTSEESLSSYISASVIKQKLGYIEAEENFNNGYGSMYFPYIKPTNVSDKNGVFGYWIASPIGGCYKTTMPYISYDGEIGATMSGYSDFGLRPVVCLKSSISGEKNGDKWILTEE